jgi:flagellar protein FlaF
VYKSPLQAYQAIDNASMNGRETEARVLMDAALKLKQCQQNWESENSHEQLDAALRYNQKIWSVFQVELERQDNPLPMTVRQNLLRLIAFIDKRIFETMAFPEPEKLTLIIQINENIAAGLRSQPQAA